MRTKSVAALRRQAKLEQHDAQLKECKKGQYKTLDDSLVAYLTKLAIHNELLDRESKARK